MNTTTQKTVQQNQRTRSTVGTVAVWLGVIVAILLFQPTASTQRVNLAKLQPTTASSTFFTDFPARNATDGVVNNDSLWISSLNPVGFLSFETALMP